MHQEPPSPVARSEKLEGAAGDGIVLIIVMGDEAVRALVKDGLMVGVDVTEVAPSVLVDGLPLVLERIVTHDRGVDELEVEVVRVV
jgi:hypothetical protein